MPHARVDKQSNTKLNGDLVGNGEFVMGSSGGGRVEVLKSNDSRLSEFLAENPKFGRTRKTFRERKPRSSCKRESCRHHSLLALLPHPRPIHPHLCVLLAFICILLALICSSSLGQIAYPARLAPPPSSQVTSQEHSNKTAPPPPPFDPSQSNPLSLCLSLSLWFF
ncbi:hypothetical protein DVH24_004079 [Malus domestica]|uniref:Transmembrane protein n=1 Tax=Malus domestica TaxID=3750 RepID=A0A498K825_MALDO|nr:hypothetical protein DVH24_004079 [Malus domestica]